MSEVLPSVSWDFSPAEPPNPVTTSFATPATRYWYWAIVGLSPTERNSKLTVYAVFENEFMRPFIFRPFVVIVTCVDTVVPPVSLPRQSIYSMILTSEEGMGKEDSLEVNRSSLRAY